MFFHPKNWSLTLVSIVIILLCNPCSIFASSSKMETIAELKKTGYEISLKGFKSVCENPDTYRKITAGLHIIDGYLSLGSEFSPSYCFSLYLNRMDKESSLDVIKSFVERGADVNYIPPKNYSSYLNDWDKPAKGSLIYSVIKRPELVMYLIDKGIDFKNPRRTVLLPGKLSPFAYAVGATPLHALAADNRAKPGSIEEKELFDLILYILEKGADINTKAMCDATPLGVAFLYGDPKMMTFLLANGADANSIIAINHTAYSGCYTYGSPLYIAIQKGWKELELLLDEYHAKNTSPEEIEAVKKAKLRRNVRGQSKK